MGCLIFFNIKGIFNKYILKDEMYDKTKNIYLKNKLDKKIKNKLKNNKKNKKI